jgi:hypothetical protein
MAEWVTAIGTILVCLLAIGGEWIKSLFFHPKVKLDIRDSTPYRIDINPPRYYLHIRVSNVGNATAKSSSSNSGTRFRVPGIV